MSLPGQTGIDNVIGAIIAAQSDTEVAIMAKCPNPDVIECLRGKPTTCWDCPARNWDMPRWQIAIWRVWRRILALLGLAALLAGCGAVHNPEHDCLRQVEQAIRAGSFGVYYATADGCRVTCTDGQCVAVCQNGAISTLFRCRNAYEYTANDAARHGAAEVTPGEAASILSASSDLLMIGACGLGLMLLVALAGGGKRRTS